MQYNFNGKILNIPDKDIENLMNCLEISKEEAIQTWLDDNDYTINETVEELSEKAKENIKRYEKSDKRRKSSTKERKVDEEKGRFLKSIRVLIEGMGAIVTNVKNEAEFSFTFGENAYTIKLIKHRPPKK
jgi:hypothetical protein